MDFALVIVIRRPSIVSMLDELAEMPGWAIEPFVWLSSACSPFPSVRLVRRGSTRQGSLKATSAALLALSKSAGQ